MHRSARRVARAMLPAALLWPAASAAQSRLPTSNGYAAGVYDLNSRRLADFLPAIYQSEGPGQPVPDLLFDAYFGLRTAEGTTWLTDVPVTRAGYVPGTNIVQVEQRVQGRTITSSYWSPWAWTAPAVVLWAEVSGAGPGDALVTLQNLHVGRPAAGGDVGAEETRPLGDGTIREAGDRFTVIHRPLVPPTGIAAPPENPYLLAQAGRAFPAPESIGVEVTDDAVLGFEFAATPDGTLRGGVLIGVPPEGEAPAVSPQAEQAAWSAWMDTLRLPEDTPLTRQQAAFLRMGQVRTAGGGQGQILASLPPGIWNIAWVRDMAYSVAAFARIGALEEAWQALEFQLEAEVGDYVDYVGRPYLISVTRYYGNGREESDSNANGPNIEWDDFGLFLWSLGHYQAAGGDLERIRPHWARIRSGVLEVIESLIDAEDLLVPDSSIWERHWEGGDLNDGLRQRFAWSSIVNAAGLCEAGRLADLLGEDGDHWRALAHRLRRGVETRLVGADGVLGASLEQVQRGSGHLDLAVVEAFNLGLLPVDGAVAQATWAAVNRALRLSPERGFKRNDDGVGRGGGPDQPGWYDEQEWVFIDLRTELWRVAAGFEGADLTQFLRGRATQDAGYLILPELLGNPAGEYAGAQPMLGFGAGAWLLGLGARPETFCAAPGEVRPDAGLDAGGGGAVSRDAGPSTTDARGPLGPDASAPTGGAGGGAGGDIPGPAGGSGGGGLPPAQDAGRGGGGAGDTDAAKGGGSGGGGGCAQVGPRPVSGLPWLLALPLIRARRREKSVGAR
jgi:hypothetical protein